jgi:osmotically-inducible protein OsmY
MADDDIERSVSDALFVDPNIAIGAAIDVTVQDGEVTLRGTVGSYGEKREAKSAAERVDGVKSVKDELKVMGLTDADLRHTVLEALKLDSRIPSTIDAEVEEGLVTLTGSVDSQHQRDAAAFIARNVPGVVDIEDQIDVQNRPWSPGDVEDSNRKALERIAEGDAESAGASGDGSHRELVDRLAAAALRIERLQTDSEAAGNVVRFHLARYVESLQSDAIDAGDRLAALTDDRSYEARVLERDISALEVNVGVAEAKLDAARAEDHDDTRGDVQAQIRAIDVETRGIRARFDRTFGRKSRPGS